MPRSKRLRKAYAQRDVAYARVVIGLLTRELTRSLRVSTRCLRTQQKGYETPGTDYSIGKQHYHNMYTRTPLAEHFPLGGVKPPKLQ